MILILAGIVGIFYFWKKDKKKRNISVLVTIVSFVLFGITSPDVEEGYEKGVESATEEAEKEELSEEVEEEPEQVEEETEKNSREDEIKEVITKRANEHSLYKNFDIENIRVNEDLGNEDSDKFIVLVDLIWTVKNKEETADDFIENISNDIAANLHNEGADDVSEIAIFTTDEYNSKQTKYSFENVGNGFKLMDHSTSI